MKRKGAFQLKYTSNPITIRREIIKSLFYSIHFQLFLRTTLSHYVFVILETRKFNPLHITVQIIKVVQYQFEPDKILVAPI